MSVPSRWGVSLAAVLLVAKVVTAIWWYTSESATAYRLFMVADPIATKVAFTVDDLLFQRRPLAPPPIESRTFELVSVVVTGAEGFVLGWAAAMLQRIVRRRASTGANP